MDSDRRSAQVERLEVVDTGRPRRWSEDEKAAQFATDEEMPNYLISCSGAFAELGPIEWVWPADATTFNDFQLASRLIGVDEVGTLKRQTFAFVNWLSMLIAL